MRSAQLAALLVSSVLLLAPNAWAVGILEVPSTGTTLSGILFASGWKCPRQGRITIVFDDHDPLPAAAGLARGDTADVCDNEGNNGFLAQFNYGLLGDGEHTVRAFDNGVEFALASFFVTTLGTSFLQGASGSYLLPDFPRADESVVVEWRPGLQNFVIVEYDDTAPEACPNDGPIQDLTNDCSDWVYFYRRNAVLADLITDGAILVICAAGSSGDILCFGGTVTSPVNFDLEVGNLNGGPFLPLGAGSQGTLGNAGQTLNFTVVLEGEAFPFTGLAFIGVEPTSADAAASSGEGSHEAHLADLLRSSALATSAAQSAGIDHASGLREDSTALKAAIAGFVRDAGRD